MPPIHAWPLILTPGVDLQQAEICSRGGEITGIAPMGLHGAPGTWGDLLEHKKTITVHDLGYSQHADPILELEVKTPRII